MDKAVCDFKSWPGNELGLGNGSLKDWEQLLPLYWFANEPEALAYSENPIHLAPKPATDGVAIVYVAGGKEGAVPVGETRTACWGQARAGDRQLILTLRGRKKSNGEILPLAEKREWL